MAAVQPQSGPVSPRTGQGLPVRETPGSAPAAACGQPWTARRQTTEARRPKCRRSRNTANSRASQPRAALPATSGKWSIGSAQGPLRGSSVGSYGTTVVVGSGTYGSPSAEVPKITQHRKFPRLTAQGSLASHKWEMVHRECPRASPWLQRGFLRNNRSRWQRHLASAHRREPSGVIRRSRTPRQLPKRSHRPRQTGGGPRPCGQGGPYHNRIIRPGGVKKQSPGA